jgi:putative membrane protein
MLWLKAFHIVFLITWFAAIFGLPRLFVHHVSIQDAVMRERFKKMERGMFGMMTFSAVLALGFGIATLTYVPGYLEMPWMRAKLTLVALLLGYHVWCYRLLVAFREDRVIHSERWHRIFNELPMIPLIAIVVLVTVKPG